MPSSGEPFWKIKAISYGKRICKRYISAGIDLNQTPDQSKLTTFKQPIPAKQPQIYGENKSHGCYME